MNDDPIDGPHDDPIEARARSAAGELIASFTDLDTEAVLRDTLNRSVTQPPTRAGRTRWIALAAAAVLIVGGTVALAVTRSRSTSPSAVSPTSVQPTIAPPSLPSATTDPVHTSVSPTTTPATTAVSTTVQATPVPATMTPATTAAETPALAASVSYLDPPPLLPIVPLTTISVPAAEDGGYAVAIGDTGVVVGQWAYGSEGSNQLDAVDFDGRVRSLPNVDSGVVLAYGPGDVAYLSGPGASVQEFAVIAIPLSGDNAGTIVATAPANINHFLEYPPFSFGHGADGVIHRREFLAGTLVTPYSDSDGSSVGLNAVPATLSGQFVTVVGGGFDAVITSSTGASWALAVDAAPDRANTYVGDSPPAPSENGTGVYVTHIGPNGNPTEDFGEATNWVIAHLQLDGSAIWWSLPDGWQVVASDVWGTVVARHTGTQLELALADFDTLAPCPNPPFEPTSLPTGVSDDLRNGDGGQIIIGDDGQTEPIQPINRDVFHYAGTPGVFINIQVGPSPGLSGTASETVSVLGSTEDLTVIEDGFKTEISHPCGTYTIVAYGISREGFRTFLEGLLPR